MEGVTRDKTWSARTPASKQEEEVGVCLLRLLHENKCFHRIDDMWQATLMPWWGMVRKKKGKKTPAGPWTFIVRIYQHCCIGWPSVEIDKGLWQPDPKLSALETHLVPDIAEWEVLPTRSTSPAHLFLKA